MKKLIIAAALFLASCTSTGQITPQSVVDEIKKDCGIVVTLADIAALITAQPQIIDIAGFATEVCNAFKSTPATPGASGTSGVIYVNNIPIHYTRP